MTVADTEEIHRSRARACLLGGAVGDALGAPIEFLSLSAIRTRFGSAGVVDFVAGDWPAGSITDDTQMTLFTAEGLIRSKSPGAGGGIDKPTKAVCDAYLRWLQTQGERPSFALPADSTGLLAVSALRAKRAPGITCLSALESMTGITDQPAGNDSKGCGGVMRVAPVGIFLAPRNGSAVGAAFKLGAECAAITHGQPTGSLAAGAFAALIAQLMVGVSLSEAILAVSGELKRHPDHEETLAALDGASRAVSKGPPGAATVESLGGGWVAEEALAIAVYCSLVAETFEEGVLLAVNHSGDSDSTGAIAGNLLGAIHGEDAIPSRWLDRLELREVIARVAEECLLSGADRTLTGRKR